MILYDLSWLIISLRYDYDDLHGEVVVRSQVYIRFPLITVIWWFSVEVEWRIGDCQSVMSMHRRRTRTLASLKMIPVESSWRSCETSLDAKVTTYYKNPLSRSKTNNLTSSCYRFDYLRRSSDIDKSNWWILEDRAEHLIDTIHWLHSVIMKTDFLTEAIKDTYVSHWLRKKLLKSSSGQSSTFRAGDYRDSVVKQMHLITMSWTLTSMRVWWCTRNWILIQSSLI